MRAELVGLSWLMTARKGFPSLRLARATLREAILPLLFVTIAVTPDGQNWVLRYSQNSNNVGIATTQSCKLNGKLVWFDAPYVHIESDSSEVVFHRETKGIPVGAVCNARFQVRRNDDPVMGDSEKDYDASGEAAEINWVQK